MDINDKIKKSDEEMKKALQKLEKLKSENKKLRSQKKKMEQEKKEKRERELGKQTADYMIQTLNEEHPDLDKMYSFLLELYREEIDELLNTDYIEEKSSSGISESQDEDQTDNNDFFI